jgi:hypothetical protein
MIPDFVRTGSRRSPSPAEQPEGAVVARLAPRIRACRRRTVSMLWLKTSGAREHRLQRLLLDAEEVGRQHLDRGLGQLRLQRPDRRRVVAGAAVGDVVAVDRGDDDVLELHLRAAWASRSGSSGSGGARACRSGRSSSGRRACTCRRGSGTSPCRGPSTRRCSGSAPPRRSCAAKPVHELLHVEVRAVLRRRAHLHPLGRRGRSATGSDEFMAAFQSKWRMGINRC